MRGKKKESYPSKIAPTDNKAEIIGNEPDLLDDCVPYQHMAEYGRYEEDSPVANQVETNMRAIRHRMHAPKQSDAEGSPKEEFMEAAQRRIQITISVDV